MHPDSNSMLIPMLGECHSVAYTYTNTGQTSRDRGSHGMVTHRLTNDRL